MSADALVQNVLEGLAVNSSYADEKIPDLIRRTINRLLRDYHFPKSVMFHEWTNAAEGAKAFELPAGFKKELEVRIYDPTSKAYTDPLRKRERFQLPYPSGAPYYYWLQGTTLVMDTPYPSSMIGYSTQLWYESMDVAANEEWITADFPDAVQYFSLVRGAAEFRKPEVMQTYGALWADEKESLAIYLNELEWSNVEMNMREARRPSLERYPA